MATPRKSSESKKIDNNEISQFVKLKKPLNMLALIRNYAVDVPHVGFPELHNECLRGHTCIHIYTVPWMSNVE